MWVQALEVENICVSTPSQNQISGNFHSKIGFMFVLGIVPEIKDV